MDNTLELFVKNNWIQEVEDVDTLPEKEQRIELLQKAGFHSQTQILKEGIKTKQEEIFMRAKHRYVLKRPSFEKTKIRTKGLSNKMLMALWSVFAFLVPYMLHPFFPSYWIEDPCGGGFDLWWIAIIVYELILFGKTVSLNQAEYREYNTYQLGINKYLVEASPQQYLGEVPNTVAQAVVKAKEDNLEPRIWAVGSTRQIPEIVEGQKIIQQARIDPLLVGYETYIPDPAPYKLEHPNRYRRIRSENYVVLLAVWGKDIEDLADVLH